jgi:hypothetical protein
MRITVSGTLTFDVEEPAAPRFLWTIQINGVQIHNPEMLTLANDHKCTAHIQPVDAHGNIAPIDGLAVWSTSSPDIVTVTSVSPDSLSADIVPGPVTGSAQVNVQADADLGSGTTTIYGVLDVQVVPGQAVGFVIATDAPEPIA